MKTNKTPKLTLVGAGPGDPELITQKGINALKSADVILYDALVNPELLNHAPENIPKIYVGKRASNHAYSQEQINNLIVDLAFSYGHVIRLKGGDPFVFGRGMEEIIHAETFNIKSEVVPGISSSIGVPALTGIPVTHRGLSESFWVITGTKSDGSISDDIQKAAKTNATVVILMGLSKLKEIVSIYTNEGKGNEAIALISNGSLPQQKVCGGKIHDVIERANYAGIKAPAIIVIGAVVEINHKYCDFYEGYLQSILKDEAHNEINEKFK